MSDSNARKVPSTGAFVTFFKSLFGAGLLALPNVLGHVGLSLGICIYMIVSLLCALSCYFLLKAREVTANHYHDLLPKKQQTHHLVTYGDLADILFGHTMASITRWTIIVINILFTAGLVIVICENVSSLFVDWVGSSGADGDVQEGDRRLMIGLCLLPAVIALLQIPWLQDMWIVSVLGLAVYTVGVIGSTLYSAFLVLQEGGGEYGNGSIRSVPDDLWDIRWGGVGTFIGSAVYAMEGINLALPTVHSMQHTSESIMVVCSAILLYGFLTMVFGAVGYAGGLGGGLGTGRTADQCDVVTNCISPLYLQWTVQIALSIAMLLSIPVMLYPSIEMLEVMLTDCQEEHVPVVTKDVVEVVEVVYTNVEMAASHAHNGESSESQLNGQNGETIALSHETATTISYGTDANHTHKKEVESLETFSQTKSWKLRIFLAFLVVTLGAATRSFTAFSGFVGAVGLTFAGFVLPPLLYLRAMQLAGLKITRSLQVGMATLLVFGGYSMVVGGTTSFMALVGGM